MRAEKAVTVRELILNREKVEAQIVALTEELKELDVTLKVVSRMRPERNGHDERRQAKKELSAKKIKRKPGRPPKAEKIGSAPQNMAEVVRQAIFAQTDEFTTNKIADYLRTHRPDVFKRLPAPYISTLLWRMTATGKIMLVRRGESGKPNTYALTHKK
jgi:hypothetical protein